MTGQVRLTVFAALATLFASASLTPVLSTGPWIGPCFLAIVVVAVSAATMRWLHAPRWAAVAVPVACLLLLLTQLFAHGVAALGLFPGPAAWRQLDATFRAGMDVLWAQAPPVTPTRGVTLIIASAIGLVAILVDLLAVTFRHAALAGVPLLALYLIPSAVVDGGAPWPVFALTAIGWLMLLVADSRSRLRRWGRTLSMRDSAEGNTPVDIALGASGRRIGAAAVVTALALPLLLPFLSSGMFGHGNGTGDDKHPASSASSSGSAGLDPVASLRRDLTRTSNTPVFTYLTSDPSPAYFRLATLTEFNGTSWEPATPRADAPPLPDRFDLPAALSSTAHSNVQQRSVFSDITVDAGYADKRLPLPITAQTVSNAGGRWLVDLNTGDVYAEVPERTTASLHYQVESSDLQPTAAQLRAAGKGSAGHVAGLGPDAATLLDVPDATRRELQPYLDALGVKANAYDQAVAIQNWLRGFTYDLGPAKNPTTGDDLGAFLTDQRGYCQQFAAVMALMSRMSGIPARVAVGFTPGSAEDTAPRVWTVTWHDAHAWPELWFAGVGWVRFEPTPAGGGGAGTVLPAWAVPPVGNGNGHLHGGHPKPNQALPADGDTGRGGSTAPAAASDTTSVSTSFDWAPWIVVAFVVAAASFLLPALVRRRTRTQRRGQTDPRLAIEAAWAEVIDTATDLELDPQAVESPRDLATRLRKHAGLSAAVVPAMTRLSRAVERARYAATPGPVDDAWADAMSVCDSMTNYAGAHRARLAKWWPASGRTELRRRWRALTDRVDLVQARTISRTGRRATASPT
jgi:transglutaminase-like putative cysteine protease